MRFLDRVDAGRQLGERLQRMRFEQLMVLALPRGGVPVAFEAARLLGAPLDVFVARKVGAPGHREFGIGAIAEGGVTVADERALEMLGVTKDRFYQLAAVEEDELQRRVSVYRRGRELMEVRGHEVVIVDDGLATGVTAEAALRSVRARGPRRLILAAPTCAPDTAARLAEVADDVVCLIAPANFAAVGHWYTNFDQTSDDEVLRLLDQTARVSAAEPRR